MAASEEILEPGFLPNGQRLKEAGWDFPKNWLDFERFFPNDDACERYLAELRWPGGFVCPRCDHVPRRAVRPNRLGRWRCPACDGQFSVTAGTIFEGTRVRMRLWFIGAWHMTFNKDGYSALAFQRDLGIKRYETAWLMFHKLRRAMIRPERSKLRGDVQVDECYVGGTERGRKGRAAAKKSLVMVAAELGGVAKNPKYRMRVVDRVRLGRIHSSSGADIVPWVLENIEEGATLITDENPAYKEAAGPWPDDPQRTPRYRLVQHNMSAWKKAVDAHHREKRSKELEPLNPLPEIHRVISLFKRLLLGTHQGGVRKKNIDHYLEEFTFRFNRKDFDEDRGLIFYRLLQQAVRTPPVPIAKIHNNLSPKEVADIWWRLTEEGVHPVLTGGWAVDACLHRQTRAHMDLDLLVDQEDLPAAIAALSKPRPSRKKNKRPSRENELESKVGVFREVEREGAATVRLVDELGRIVDLHPMLALGGGVMGELLEGEGGPDFFPYPAESLDHDCMLYGLAMKCVDPEQQLLRREGIGTTHRRRASVRNIVRGHGLERAVTVRRAIAAVTRRRPEDDLDLPLLRALVAGTAAVGDTGKPLSPDELRLLGEVDVPESQIVSLRDFADIQEALDQEYEGDESDEL